MDEKKKSFPSIYQILGLLLIASIWAFNEEKYITYPVKILFIFVFGLYWLRSSGGKLNKFQIWCLIMCGASVAAALRAEFNRTAIYTLVNVFQCFLIAFTLSAYLEEKDETEWFLKSFVWGGMILLARLILVTPLSVWLSFDRLGDAIGYNANDVGNKAAFAAIIAICLFRNKTEKHKAFYAVSFILLTAIVLFSGSRKALLGLVLAVILLYTIGLEKKQNMVFTIGGLIVLMYLGYQLVMTNASLYQTIGRRIESMINVVFHGASEASSIDLREKFMAMAWGFVQDSPILGIGLGNFAIRSGLGLYCHCDYLEVMCSYGIPFALVYYFPLVFIFLRGLAIKKKTTMDHSVNILCLVLLVSFLTMVMYISAYTQMLVVIMYAYQRNTKANCR